jgi:hypothetical protein
MNKLLLITVACYLLIQETPYGQSPESEIKQMHALYCTAVEQKDSVTLKGFFHDRMVVTGGNGTRRSKQEELKDLLDVKYKVNYFKSRNEDVRVFDGTALVTGEFFWEIVYEGKTSVIERSFTFTYSRVGKKWKIVAQHMGRAPQKGS